MMERRKRRRFPMQYPVTLKLQENGQREIHGIARNASELGVLLVTDSQAAAGTRVDLTLTLLEDGIPAVRLFGSGKVIRVENESSGKWALAVECDKALEQREFQVGHHAGAS